MKRREMHGDKRILISGFGYAASGLVWYALHPRGAGVEERSGLAKRQRFLDYGHGCLFGIGSSSH